MANSLLFCVQGTGKTVHREPVTVANSHLPKLDIYASAVIAVGSPVSIEGDRHCARAVVTGCRASKEGFVVTVQIKRGGQWLVELLSDSNHYDPGVHSITNFIADEQLFQVAGDSKTCNARR